MKMIIDVDTGSDDAQAIMLALSSSLIKVIAITCVSGNVELRQVCRNTARILRVFKKQEVLLYAGCDRPLIAEPIRSKHVHGNDGMGGMDEEKDEPDIDNVLQKEHASNAMVSLINQFPGEVILVMLGPLTNLAVALKIDPNLLKKLKSCTIMGGNYTGLGNVTTKAEFNFLSDPEAASIVLGMVSSTQPIVLVPWETTLNFPISWSTVNFLKTLQGQIPDLYRGVTKVIHKVLSYHEGDIACDLLAMAVALDPEVGRKVEERHADIELYGKHCRGLVVIERRKKVLGKIVNNIVIITEIDIAKVELMMSNMLTMGTPI